MPSLPTIVNLERAVPTLKLWQQQLNQGISSPQPPRTPFNFHASGGASGSRSITLNWETISGADGYQIQMSATGDFSSAPIIATISNTAATSWSDDTVVTSVKRWYRIRSTAGTSFQPQSVQGIWSAPIISTSGNNATTYDQTSGTSGNGGWNKPAKVR